MDAMAQHRDSAPNLSNSRDIGDLDRAAAKRREGDIALPMNERLARLHALCLQMSEVKGAARAR